MTHLTSYRSADLPLVSTEQSGGGASRRHLLVLGLCLIAVALAGALVALSGGAG